MILSVDVGGTKTLAALFDYPPPESSQGSSQTPSGRSAHQETGQNPAPWHPAFVARWPSRDFQLESIMDFLVNSLGSQSLASHVVRTAGFSLAGPILNDQCHLVNLERTLDFSSVRQQFPQISSIFFANDVLATAHALMVLPSSSIVSLTPQPPPFMIAGKESSDASASCSDSFPIAVLAPGTGLGQSLLLSARAALGSEGAHTDFAPRTEQEVRLWRFLRHRFGHVSYERILSGPGLCNIYSFLAQENPADNANYAHSPADTDSENSTKADIKVYTHSAIPADSDQATPSPPEITSRALTGSCPLCQASLDLFIDILGAQAGNLALQTMATGGVCLAGGIVPHILPALRQEKFLQAFLDKGRFRDVVSQIPVAAVCNDQAALWGAAYLAYINSLA